MRFGLQLSPYVLGDSGNVWDTLAAAAKFADTSAFDSIWLYDHFLYEGGYSYHPISEPVMECFTTLGALAAITERVRLGQLVLGVPYRNPAMMAKMATTLDVISHGRSILGLGAGWHQREYEGYGWGTFEPASVRLKRLEEAIQIVLALWGHQPAELQGKYYRLEHVMDNPQPIQKPHPPILIGGMGEKVTLRLAAQYGQFCNVWGTPQRVQHLFQVLNNHCIQVTRPYDEITRSIFVTVIIGRNEVEVAHKRERLHDYLPSRSEVLLIGTPEQVIGQLEPFFQVGCQYVIVRMPDWMEIEPLQLFAQEVIPTFGGQ